MGECFTLAGLYVFYRCSVVPMSGVITMPSVLFKSATVPLLQFALLLASRKKNVVF